MPKHQYVPVHGMQWVWLIMVAPLVVSHVDGYRCVKGGEEMMGTCAEQTESETKTTLTVVVGNWFVTFGVIFFNIFRQHFHHIAASNVIFLID